MKQDLSELPADALPESFREFADYVPVKALWRLVETFGGRMLKVPAKFTPSGKLAAALGLEWAKALCDACGGEELYVPRATEAHLTIRNREIQRLRVQEGLNNAELSRRFGLTTRQIMRILAAGTSSRSVEDGRRIGRRL